MEKKERRYLSILTEYMEKTKLELDKLEDEFWEQMTRVQERMRKMAEEENATPKDLVEFLELSFPQPSACVSDPAPAPAPAPVDSENKARGLQNRPGPADAVRR